MKSKTSITYIHTFISVLIVSIGIVSITKPANAYMRHTSNVHMFSNGSVIPDAWSTITTTSAGASMTLYTSHLPTNSAVTVWWVIFNQPQNCTHGAGGFRCGEGDLENSAVQASVLYATGHIVGLTGVANFIAFLPSGSTQGALFGPGLTNPTGADIHLVARSHGPIIPDMALEQITTFGGGCNNVPPGTGTPGPNTCVDLQFSVHEQ